MKSVLEGVPVYWFILDHILAGILDNIRKKFFSFLWAEKREKEELPLVSWKKMAKPKKVGGWGLKNIHLFKQALAAKKYVEYDAI